MTNFRVRFAVPLSVDPAGCQSRRTQGNDRQATHTNRQHSRLGCLQCKRWRVKCDEHFPVCRRCSQRGIICSPAPRASQWQIELPGITIGIGRISSGEAGRLPANAMPRDDGVLQYWFQHTCFIMISDGSGETPYSYMISSFLSISRSLLHSLRSVSLGHQNYFRAEALNSSLDERHKAITACLQEMSADRQPMHLYFFIAYMLGVSSSYFDPSVSDFGKIHLLGARDIIDTILADETLRADPMTPAVFGAFTYWDLSCSLLVDPSEQKDIDTPLISSYVQETAHIFDPVTGRSTEVFHLSAVLGRYVRATLGGVPRNPQLEDTLRAKFQAWNTDDTDTWWSLTGEAFRWHGLVSLHRLSNAGTRGSGDPSARENTYTGEDETIHSCALWIVELLIKIPPTLPLVSLQALPLLTAGAELTEDDPEVRQQVRMRLEALYSFNRIPTSLLAVQLLEEVWECRRKGSYITWQEVMLGRNWRLRV